MNKYGDALLIQRKSDFQIYTQQHPLTPLHYIVDLGSNPFMQSIIISVQGQFIDFSTIGYQRRNHTCHLYTIEAMTQPQFLKYLFGHSIKDKADLKSKTKQLIRDLDKDWLKNHKAAISKAKKKNTQNVPLPPSQEQQQSSSQQNKNKNKNKNTSDETINIEIGVQQEENIENENQQPDINVENESQVEEMNIDNESQVEEKNIENGDSDNYNLFQVNCVGKESNNLLIHPGLNTQSISEGNLLLAEEHKIELEKLKEVCSNYSFDHLDISDFDSQSDDDDDEYKFEFQKLDKFNHQNWTQWKFIDSNGKIVRRFAPKKTAEQVRMCTARSMKENSLQTEVWQYDNRDAIQKEKQILEEIKNGAKKKIIYTSEEDKAKALRRKLARNNWKPIEETKSDDDDDDDDDDEIEDDDSVDDDDIDDDEDDQGIKHQSQQPKRKRRRKTRKKRKPRIEKVEIVYDNTFAHLVTSDAGMLLTNIKYYIFYDSLPFIYNNIIFCYINIRIQLSQRI